MKPCLTVVQTRFITIRTHDSYISLFELALGTWSLGQIVLPQRLDGQAQMWLPAVLLMAMYVTLVAVHEAAHQLVGRRLHVPMPQLNVHPIGTLARFEREAVGPHRTFAVAAAGPLANIIL